MSITPSQQVIIPKLKKRSLLELLEKGKRIDGRGSYDYRPVRLYSGVIEKAEGSALARIGKTMALVGVKVGVGVPYPDTPNMGVLAVNAEFVPLASPTFEPGPPDENAVELARVIDRSIRELKVLDLEKLAIIPGEKVYIVWLDIYVLDHDGNLIDACMLASMTALLTSRLPKAVVDEKGSVQLVRDETTDMPVNGKVVIVTLGKIGKHLIVDPCLEEEQVLDSKISIAVSEDSRIAGAQRAGLQSMSEEEVRKAIDIAFEVSRMLLEKVDEASRRPSTLWEALIEDQY